MSDSIFTKIIKREIPADVIYEDTKVIAFLDINPVNQGHTLLVTKEPYTWMSDVPDELLQYAFTKAKELMIPLKEATKADFVAVLVMGIDVPHFHINLVPRKYTDKPHSLWPTKKYKYGEAKTIAEKIKINLSK